MSNVVHPGVVLAGNYQVEQLLGEGGMGLVVAARRVTDDKLVALKCMLPQALAFPQALQRFMREGKVLARFAGENLIRLVDHGMLGNGAPYFAMEYVDGIDLSKLVRQYGALSVRNAVEFVLQACIGVAEAHRCGIVHRDLKPSNLLLTQRDDGSPLIKVLDFGLSKILAEEGNEPSPSQTQTTGTMGTPAFMSPEQARSAKHVDERADVWSLGGILYYLLTAGLPFPAQATAEAFAKLLYEEPVPVRDAAPWVKPELEAVILRCLQKDVAKRQQSVDALVSDLEPFAGGDSAANRSMVAWSKVIIDGPEDLDVGLVLQQRTTMTFDSLELLAGPSITPADLPACAQPESRRKKRDDENRGSVMMAAVIGMIVGACIIGGAISFFGEGMNSAATQLTSQPDSPAPAATVPVPAPTPVATPVAVPVPAPTPVATPVAVPESVDRASSGGAEVGATPHDAAPVLVKSPGQESAKDSDAEQADNSKRARVRQDHSPTASSPRSSRRSKSKRGSRRNQRKNAKSSRSEKSSKSARSSRSAQSARAVRRSRSVKTQDLGKTELSGKTAKPKESEKKARPRPEKSDPFGTIH
ncbi:MAG: protein kinase [Proteobacteria bacterium]|nr:protein kinase [Pseudomonadota bacterium]